MPFIDDKYTYTISELRAVEEMYIEGRDVIHYEDSRGREYIVANPISIAEYRCDFERAAKHIRIKVGKKTGYKQILEMTRWLNGE